jgi:HSP20 family protein
MSVRAMCVAWRKAMKEAAMAVIRHEPYRDPLEQLLSLAASGKRAALAMPIDVYRAQDGSYHVEADLPGVDADTMEVTVEHSILTIRAQRTAHYADTDHVVAAERPQGSFSRQLTLGEGVDADHLTAEYTEGVLHVTIPASPKVQPRRIQVTHGTAAAAEK